MALKTGQPEIVNEVVNYRNFNAVWGNFQKKKKLANDT